jgi:hypothetical protein
VEYLKAQLESIQQKGVRHKGWRVRAARLA